MSRRYLLHRTNSFINCRHASQSMLQSIVNEKSGIATLILNKKPVNGLNFEFLDELKTQINQLQNDKIRGMLLTSSVQKVFCGGFDITEFYNPNPDRLTKFWTTLQDTWLALYLSSFPTAAIINGHCPGGGCLLAMGCDYRVMVGPKYTIGFNKIKLGLVVPKWFKNTMVSVIGQRNTEISLLTGKRYTADEALKIGLVDESVPDTDTAFNKGIQYLNTFQNISFLAYRMTKDINRQPTVQWLIDNKQKDLDYVLEHTQSPDIQRCVGLYLQSLKK